MTTNEEIGLGRYSGFGGPAYWAWWNSLWANDKEEQPVEPDQPGTNGTANGSGNGNESGDDKPATIDTAKAIATWAAVVGIPLLIIVGIIFMIVKFRKQK